MKTDCKYGYKVCYKELEKSKLKLFLVTNSFDLAVWHVRWYEREPPPKVRTHEWEIREVKTLKEYERLWKGCPCLRMTFLKFTEEL